MRAKKGRVNIFKNGNGLEEIFDQNRNRKYKQNQNCIHSPKLDLKISFFDEKQNENSMDYK